MFKRILVPLDGSKLAEQALAPAIQIAQRWNGELILMRVPIYLDSRVQMSPVYDFYVSQESIQPLQENTADYLRITRENLLPSKVNIRSIIGEGDRAGAIVDTALIENVDLIVMSTHGRTGLSRWVFGSITSKVLGHAHCPVLVIGQTGPFTHVLITLDGSLLAEEAIMPGLDLAAAFGSRVTLLRVQQPSGEPDQIDVLQDAEQYLIDIIAINHEHYKDIHWEILSGPIASSILEYAETHEVDLIAMTTHGRTGIQRWIYGSITEKVLFHAPQAMLIVRPPKKVR